MTGSSVWPIWDEAFWNRLKSGNISSSKTNSQLFLTSKTCVHMWLETRESSGDKNDNDHFNGCPERRYATRARNPSFPIFRRNQSAVTSQGWPSSRSVTQSNFSEGCASRTCDNLGASPKPLSDRFLSKKSAKIKQCVLKQSQGIKLIQFTIY